MGGGPSQPEISGRAQLQYEAKTEDDYQEDEARTEAAKIAVNFGISEHDMMEVLDRRATTPIPTYLTEELFRSDDSNTSFQVLFGEYAGFGIQNRKFCQDRVLVKEIELKDGRRYLVAAVFDGHGTFGAECSEYIINNGLNYKTRSTK